MIAGLTVIGLSGTATAGDIACNSAEQLEMTLEQSGVPYDEYGRPMIGCTIWPVDRQYTVVRVLKTAKFDCGTFEESGPYGEVAWHSATCYVPIAEVREGVRAFYLAIGWFAAIDDDHAVDLIADDFLPTGSPCTYFACEVRGSPVAEEEVLVASE
jgi:hypothetical protein